jgi:hypothetical protein
MSAVGDTLPVRCAAAIVSGYRITFALLVTRLAGELLVESTTGAVAEGNGELRLSGFDRCLNPRPSSVSSRRSSNQDLWISHIRLADKTSRLRPRLVVPKPAQAYEPEVPIKVREWIGPAPVELSPILGDGLRVRRRRYWTGGRSSAW